MQADICSRGFPLTEGLLAAIEHEAADFARRGPRGLRSLSVRLYDVNGRRGGQDKVCLIHGRLGRDRASVVATAVDADLYRAIAVAFARLERCARTAQQRSRSLLRRPAVRTGAMRAPLPA